MAKPASMALSRVKERLDSIRKICHSRGTIDPTSSALPPDTPPDSPPDTLPIDDAPEEPIRSSHALTEPYVTRDGSSIREE